MKFLFGVFGLFLAIGLLGCRVGNEISENRSVAPASTFQPTPLPQSTPSVSPSRPNLLSAILDDRYKKTNSPIGSVDFKNYSYPLPHGWQNPDNSDLTLTNGKLDPVGADTDIGMDPDEAAAAKSQRRIGATYEST